MKNNLRLFLLSVIGVGFTALVLRLDLLHIRTAHAVPGALTIGSQNTQTVYYYNQAVYSNDLLFGNGTGGSPGVITAQGQVLINLLTPTPGFGLNVNQRARANALSVNTVATDKMFELAGDANMQGNVGIGFGAPSVLTVPLTVHSSNNSSVIKLEGSDGGAGVTLGERGGNATIDSNMEVAGTGLSTFAGNLNVNGTGANTMAGSLGIGTTSPITRLDVRQNDVEAARFYGTGTYSGYIGVGYQPNLDYGWISSFNSGGTAKNMSINGGGGSVGIGTTSPGTKLDVAGTFQVRGSQGNVSVDASGNLYAPVALTVGSTGLDGTLRVYKNSGLGGRNTVSLTNGTPVAAGSTKSSSIQFKDNNNATQIEIGNDRNVNGTHDFYVYDAVSAADRLYIASNGNVGIGTTTAGAKLTVAGSARGNAAGGALRIDTGNGYVDIGPQNASWAHFTTDRPNFYFGSPIHVNGTVCRYGGNCADMNWFNQSVTTAAGPTFQDVYTNGWFRNNNASQGLYNTATGKHFYSESASYWTVADNNGLIFRNGAGGTVTGYVYWDGTAGSNNFGLLSPSGGWRVRTDNSNVELYGGAYMGTAYANILYDRTSPSYYVDPNSISNLAIVQTPQVRGDTINFYNNAGSNTGTYPNISSMSMNNLYGYISPYTICGRSGNGCSIGANVTPLQTGNASFYGSVWMGVYDGFGNVYGTFQSAGQSTFGDDYTTYWGASTIEPNVLIKGNNQIRFGTKGVRLYSGNGDFIPNSCGGNWYTGIQSGMWSPDYSTGCGDEWMLAMQSEDGAENSRLILRVGNDANDDVFIRGTGGTTTGTGDLAELYYSNDDLKLGEVVANDPVQPAGVKRATREDLNTLTGVTSAKPFALLMSQSEKVSKDTVHYKPISLAGKIIVRVSLENGPIKAGDPLTVSSTPGYAMKAIRAGMIIGRAHENFDGSELSSSGSEKMYSDISEDCPSCGAAVRIFPKGNPVTPGTYQKGSMVMLVNVGWYDPDMTLTSTGDFKIAQNNTGYEVRKGESIVTRIAAMAELVAAKIQAGAIEAKQLVVRGVDVLKAIQDLQARSASSETKLQDALKVIDQQNKRIDELEKAVNALRAK